MINTPSAPSISIVQTWLMDFVVITPAQVSPNVLEEQLKMLHPNKQQLTIWCWPIGVLGFVQGQPGRDFAPFRSLGDRGPSSSGNSEFL